jgi:hypothetical protein
MSRNPFSPLFRMPRIISNSAVFVLLANATLFASRADLVQPISAEALRADIAYLASDALEGRLTPSHGLDLAADYIAAQFQRAGLEPAAPDYFQVAKFDEATTDMQGFHLTLSSGTRESAIPGTEVVSQSLTALDLTDASVLKLPTNGVIPAVTGRIVAGDESRYSNEVLLNELESRKPSLILLVGRTDHSPPSPLAPDPGIFLDEEGNSVPLLHIRNSQALDLLHQRGELNVTLHLAKPALKPATVRNVAAILPGSDPALRRQYVLVTAHYDHMGRNARGIFRGANDNASGTASVIEIARALASQNPRPKRSVVFIALFGEEEGLLGAYYYTHHPLVPLRDTIADINLEQMGRTDDTGGKRVGEFGLTGPSFSNVPAIMSEGAKKAGVNVYTRPDADQYFDRSDNFAFAQFGIIAHTAAVAFEYPDYHALGDTPEKIDYANLALVDRGVAAGIVALADAPHAPHWSTSPGARVYIDAGR